MKKISVPRIALIFGLAAACALAFVGCSGNASSSSTVSSTGAALTGGVAATVNGVEIPEDEVTTTVENGRASMGLTDEASWGQWLAQMSYTPETIREQTLQGLINQEIIRQGASQDGISVDSGEIDGYVDRMKSNYESDEAWQQALQGAGLTEEEYRKNIELQLLASQIQDTLQVDEPAQEDLTQYAQMYAQSYNGAKRSSHILFDANDEATAQEVLDKLNSGELDFAEAAKTYSKDTGSAANGGDVGWDALTTFVQEYTDGLANLEEGQISGLVPSTYGIHIIKVTDVFNAPEEVTSIDQLPAEFADNIRQMLTSTNKSKALQTWIDQHRESLNVIINDMPQNLPYFVDMTQYQTTDESASDMGEGGDEAASDNGTEENADATTTETPAEEGETTGATE